MKKDTKRLIDQKRLHDPANSMLTRFPQYATPPRPLTLAQLEDISHAIREGKVDALFLADANRHWLFTLSGSESAYRLLIENMSEGAVTVTADGAIGYANASFAEMLGRPLQSVIGVSIMDCFAPEDHAALHELLACGLRGKHKIELERLTESGMRAPTLLSVRPMSGEGLPGAVCLIATDLTAQKRSEAAIRARERLLKVLQLHKRVEEKLHLSLETLKLHDSALGAISQGVIITDRSSRITYVNAAFEAITGYRLAEVAGSTCSFLQGRDTCPVTRQQLVSCIRTASPYHGELLNYRKDGTPFWNEMSITPVLDDHGVVTQFVGVQRDITARRLADEQLLLAAKVFEQSTEGFAVTDLHNRIVKVNSACTAIMGMNEVALLGQDLLVLLSGVQEDVACENIQRALDSSGRWQGEMRVQREHNKPTLLSTSISRVNGLPGLHMQHFASFTDITQRKEDEEKLHHLAHFDVLTGTANRSSLAQSTAQAFQQASRNKESVAMMFLDLDRFKNVNDSFGHSVGDALLVAIVERISANVRLQDTVARVGGDEFVLLLPGTDADGAVHLAQKLVELLRLPFYVLDHELQIGISIGIALYPDDGDDFETLCKSADVAMYRAKQDGGDTFHFYTDQLEARLERMLAIENALRSALARDELQVVYQPQTSLHSGRIERAEALLRWTHPKLGSIPPAEFIPIAESSGLISTIGQWVLTTTMRQLRSWRDAGLAPLTVAVNLSAAQFRQRDLLEMVRRVLDDAGVPPHCLELELTENIALNDPEGAIAIMDELNANGIHMAIDDFGTGYSSLNYLKRFRINRLKIDKSFVHDIMDNPEDRAIVRAIISVAKSLGMQTIAEGVETKQQMELLRETGCDELQGFWLSRPLSPSQFVEFMAKAR